MKKRLVCVLALLFVLFCTSYIGRGQKIINFDSTEIVSVEIYSLHGSFSKRKIVNSKKDVDRIIRTLSAAKIKGDGANAEPVAGGAIQFVFNKTDGTQFILSYDGATIRSPGAFWYEVGSRTDIFDLWSHMRYDEQEIPEYELPLYLKDRVPSLGLIYEIRGDRYHLGALLGTSSWSYENEDGTITSIESDSTHPLDSTAQLPEILEADKINEIRLSFSMPPDRYTVKRWKDQYTGNNQAYEKYEVIHVSGDNIALSSNDKGYIYEVHATWPQGDAYYSFYIK